MRASARSPAPGSADGGAPRPRVSRAGRGLGGLSLAAAWLFVAAPGSAAVFVLDAEASRVRFELGATLHTVEGRVPVLSGRIRFDPEGGPAAGEVVLDAKGIETGIDRRDRVMHETVLESERHPRIVFTPERLEVVERGGRQAEVRLHGALAIHGGTHDVTLPARVRAEEGRLRAEGSLRIPYVEWGMEDPSTFVLRVAKELEARFEVVGDVEGMELPEPAPPPGGP